MKKFENSFSEEDGIISSGELTNEDWADLEKALEGLNEECRRMQIASWKSARNIIVR